MPWWFWIVLWVALLLASAAGLAVVCWRVFRSGLALLREVDRAAAAVTAPSAAPPAVRPSAAAGAGDVAGAGRELA